MAEPAYNITLKHTTEERTVEVSTNNELMTLDDFFYLWVDFASGCGFSVDRAEMEDMWDGVENTAGASRGPEVESTEKLARAIEALEGVKEFVEALYPFRDEQTVLVPRLAAALETLEELKR